MDTGTINFVVKLNLIELWGITGRAYIEFPHYYRPNIGRGIICTIDKPSVGII